MTAAINIRPASTEDIPFLVTTFCRSFSDASAYAEHVEKQTLADLLARALLLWPAFVAVTPDDPDTILGWIVGTGNVCAWTFVRPELRRKGLAKALLVHADICRGSIVTPFAPTRLKWLNDKWSVRFRPFLVAA